ncbi:hypothetical protein D9M70_269320 [compost metagenome]
MHHTLLPSSRATGVHDERQVIVANVNVRDFAGLPLQRLPERRCLSLVASGTQQQRRHAHGIQGGAQLVPGMQDVIDQHQ